MRIREMSSGSVSTSFAETLLRTPLKRDLKFTVWGYKLIAKPTVPQGIFIHRRKYIKDTHLNMCQWGMDYTLKGAYLPTCSLNVRSWLAHCCFCPDVDLLEGPSVEGRTLPPRYITSHGSFPHMDKNTGKLEIRYYSTYRGQQILKSLMRRILKAV